MTRNTRRGTLGALLIGLLAVALSAAPALGYALVSETGDTGFYTVYDEELGPHGANCIYETGSPDLDKISVRPVQTHSSDSLPSGTVQKIKERFIIQRQAPPFTGSWVTIFASSWATSTATEATVTSFVRRTWIAPESPTGRHRVQVVLRWIAPGTSDTTVGKAVLRYEWYKSKRGASQRVDTPYCLEDY